MDWNKSLVGWWRFEGNYNDSSSYGTIDGNCSATCPKLTTGPRGKAYEFTGNAQRIEINEYPLEAIREAVINSVMHRDYFETGHNNVLRIFPDMITLTNVWSKPSWFKIEKDTFRRNNLIADMLQRINYIEKIGSGIARMKKYCKESDCPTYKFDNDEKYFRIGFFKSRRYLRLFETTLKTTLKTTPKNTILQLIQDDPCITKEKLAIKLQITVDGVKYHIRKLKNQGKIRWVGPARGGYWEIK